MDALHCILKGASATDAWIKPYMKLANLMKLYTRIDVGDFISANCVATDLLKEDCVLALNQFTKIRRNKRLIVEKRDTIFRQLHFKLCR